MSVRQGALYKSNKNHPSKKHYYIVKVVWVGSRWVKYRYVDTNRDAVDKEKTNDLNLSLFKNWYDLNSKNEYKQISNNYNI